MPRPSRTRKSVSHYSDDNPNTFTVKPPRGQLVATLAADAAARRQQRRAEKRREERLKREQEQEQEEPQRRIRPRVIQVLKDPPTPPSDTILAHAVALAPLDNVLFNF